MTVARSVRSDAAKLRVATAPAIQIRKAAPDDHAAIGEIILPVIRSGETYALDRNMDERAALAYWLGPDRETFVAVADGAIVGTYYLRPNQAGGGRHVANCGYMVRGDHVGRGIGRAMCEQSLIAARARGYRALQFNFVVSTNERAVHLWQTLGFAIVGRLPGAFEHPQLGFVDALVMYRSL